MMTDIDAALRRLTDSDHPGLAAIERSVMARIQARRRAETAFGTPMMAMATLAAIALGVTAGTLRSAPTAAASLSPFGPSIQLAPSTLLASDR